MNPSLGVGRVQLVVQGAVHVALVPPPAEFVQLVRVPGQPLPLHVTPDVILVDEIYPVCQLGHSHHSVTVRVDLGDEQPQPLLGLLRVEPGELLRLVNQEVLGSVRVEGVDLVSVLEGGHVHHTGLAEGRQQEQAESPHHSVASSD